MLSSLLFLELHLHIYTWDHQDCISRVMPNFTITLFINKAFLKSLMSVSFDWLQDSLYITFIHANLESKICNCIITRIALSSPMGLILCPKCVIPKSSNLYLLLLCQMCITSLIVWVGIYLGPKQVQTKVVQSKGWLYAKSRI